MEMFNLHSHYSRDVAIDQYNHMYHMYEAEIKKSPQIIIKLNFFKTNTTTTCTAP